MKCELTIFDLKEGEEYLCGRSKYIYRRHSNILEYWDEEAEEWNTSTMQPTVKFMLTEPIQKELTLYRHVYIGDGLAEHITCFSTWKELNIPKHYRLINTTIIGRYNYKE